MHRILDSRSTPYLFKEPSATKSASVALSLFKSPSFWSFLLLTGAVVMIALLCGRVIPLTQATGPITFSLFCVGIFVLSENWKQVKYEVTLIKMLLFKRNWYSEMTEQIVLGAIPLEKHRDALKSLGITHVLSLAEDFEFEETFFSQPLQHEKNERWLHLVTPDFEGLPLPLIERGIDWMHTKISEGGKIYLHCKGGVGRSAILMLAYFMKYQKLSKEEALATLSKKCPVSLSSSQRQSVDYFYKTLTLNHLN